MLLFNFKIMRFSKQPIFMCTPFPHTCSLLPNNARCWHTLRLTMQHDVAVAFHICIDRLDNPSWWHCRTPRPKPQGEQVDQNNRQIEMASDSKSERAATSEKQ